MLPLRKKCQVRNVLVCKPGGIFGKKFLQFLKRGLPTQKLSPKIFLISKNGKKY